METENRRTGETGNPGKEQPHWAAPITLSGFRLGSFAIVPSLVLAPMAGLTDRAFRRLVRSCGGVGLVVGEITSSEGLTRGNLRAERLIAVSPDEHPIALQISGSDAGRMAEAARRCARAGADLVDINMGCPVPKITRTACGSALMRDPAGAASLARAVVEASPLPVTVKMRLGWSEGSMTYLDLAARLQDAGVAGIALHARTREDGYSGRARWEHIARMKEAVSIPVVGNGDATTPEEVLDLFRDTGCDAVMVGRAALKNPWIFRQAVDLAATGSYAQPGLSERVDLTRRHFGDLMREEPPSIALYRMKSFLGKFTKGIPGASKLRAGLDSYKEPRALMEAFEAWAEIPPTPL
jgi:tRNA-dihydrouridine synthase B